VQGAPLLAISALVQPPKRRAANILLVDDNPSVLKLLGSLFTDEGMSVTLAESAKQARAALESGGKAFDLVLSDISMPGETGFDLLQWIKRPDSPFKELPVLLTTAQLPEAENRVKGLAMGAVDYVVRPIELRELVIRALHAVEYSQRVQSLEGSLKDSASLALVGRLLAASHHEIKNLAMLVKLSSDQTIKSFEGRAANPGEAAALRSLGQSAALLTDVAKSVSTLLAPEAAHSQAVDLSALVREVAELMGQRIKPIWIDAPRAGGTAVWARGHVVRLKQVLINLMLNAADAINELAPEEGGRITVALATDGDAVTITVTDNGIGFPAAATRSEFPAFATTKKLRGGQGLGLWLCAELMRNLGGRLTLASKGPTHGAVATMQLVAATKPQEIDIQKYLDDLELSP
jgi:signal transduction histidine kinase